MSAPHSESRAHKIMCVVRGQGRVEIISPEGAQQQMRRQEGGEEEEREWERESRRGEGGRGRGREEEEGERGEGDFRLSYHRIEEEMQQGDCCVVPAGHLSTQISSSNQRFELLTFTVNDNERNQVIFYAGKNSELREMRNEVLAASFKEREDEVKRMFESQNDQIFLKGSSQSGRGSRDIL